MRTYPVQLEIAGSTAMWTRPDTGDAPTSYPAPTFSAVKGIFESVLWLQSAEVCPTRIEICAPLVYHNYTTNYGGPLRKTDQITDGNNYQMIATVLIDVCYRLYGEVRSQVNPPEVLTPRARAWSGVNGGHAYQEMFEDRLRKGRFYQTPCLGWQEFVPDYLGPLRPETQVQDDLTFVLPSMLYAVFPGPKRSPRAPQFRQNVRIEKGVLNYAS
jgi:CRISPR-associated protein Cas5d